MVTHPDPRPELHPALHALIGDICARVPAFQQIEPSRILIIAGAAHESSRATIRWLLEPGFPRVVVDGKARHFEITLRPLFFLQANGLGRLITLFHELFHIDPDDGTTLADDRRHRGNPRLFDAAVEKMARAYAQEAPLPLLAPLGHEGEVLMRQWKLRPSAVCRLKQVGNAQLFVGPVRMHTPRRDRTGWW